MELHLDSNFINFPKELTLIPTTGRIESKFVLAMGLDISKVESYIMEAKLSPIALQYTMKSTHRTDQFEPFLERYFRNFTLPWVGVWVGKKRRPNIGTK